MDKKYTIKYLGHSAFLVTTQKYYLFFDYVGTVKKNMRKNLEEEFIDFENYKDKKIIMFYSHNHFDHYNKELHEKTQKYENIISVLGDIKSDLENTITIKPRETKHIDDITIHAGASTDLGVCYLINIDGFTIYHGGDNAAWDDVEEMQKKYYREINYIASFGLNINIAFIPICKFTGRRPKWITEGAIYLVKVFNPDVVVPMHSAGKEDLYNKFYIDALEEGCNNKVICMEKLGQEYSNC